MKVKASESIKWIESMVGNPYLWGGQGESIFDILRKYAKQLGQSVVATDKMIEFLKEHGVVDKRFFDCSGLGVSYLIAFGALKYDTTANGLYKKCDPIEKEKVRAGDFVFFVDGECASHVGYMVTDEIVVHALDQSVGVIREKLSARKEWNAFGRPTAYIEYDLEEEVSDAKNLKVGDKITVKKQLKRYDTALDAKSGTRAKKDLYEPGEFYVYKIDSGTGSVNITKTKGQAGSWVML